MFTPPYQFVARPWSWTTHYPEAVYVIFCTLSPVLQAPSLGDSVEHHFIAFVEKDGKIYELDGRKSGPIAHGSVDGSFLKVRALIPLVLFISAVR